MLNKILDPKNPEIWSPEDVERNLRAALENFKLPHQEELTNAPARVGKPMKDTDVIDKVRKLSGYLIWSEDSIACPGGANFYRWGLNGKKECLDSAFKRGMLPQWTTWHQEEMGLVEDVTVGWMQILSRLVQKGSIRYQDISKEFNLGNEDIHAARFWKQQMKDFR